MRAFRRRRAARGWLGTRSLPHDLGGSRALRHKGYGFRDGSVFGGRLGMRDGRSAVLYGRSRFLRPFRAFSPIPALPSISIPAAAAAAPAALAPLGPLGLHSRRLFRAHRGEDALLRRGERLAMLELTSPFGFVYILLARALFFTASLR